MSTKLVDDCFFHDKDRIPHSEALAILKSRVSPVVGPEDVPLESAAGRYLAAPVIAPRNIPAHANAAVDGYAFAHASYDPEKGTTYSVVGVAAAGHPLAAIPPPDEAVRVFTGAVIPEGFDTVVMQEDVRLEIEGGRIVGIPPGVKKGLNRRLAGEDCAAGATLVEPGARLRPQDVASAAACGFATLRCHEVLKVGVVSTGDEILRSGMPFCEGKVYDANAPLLAGLIQATGAEPVDLGVLPDEAKLVRSALTDASQHYNVLVISGGASLGAEDHVVHAIEALGKRHLWQIAIKPGRPMSFGQIGDCAILGLPGNPVAVFVCFLLYVRPVLAALAGGNWPEPVRYPLPAAFSQKKKAGRREFWRARLVSTDGHLSVVKFARDGSGLISSLREADGLIEVGERVTEVNEGDLVNFIPFAEFGLQRA
jgi:molybdopterin molybdotransferase